MIFDSVKKEQHLKPSPFKMNINRLSFQVLMVQSYCKIWIILKDIM